MRVRDLVVFWDLRFIIRFNRSITYLVYGVAHSQESVFEELWPQNQKALKNYLIDAAPSCSSTTMELPLAADSAF